jgi:hypothetical protein
LTDYRKGFAVETCAFVEGAFAEEGVVGFGAVDVFP